MPIQTGAVQSLPHQRACRTFLQPHVGGVDADRPRRTGADEEASARVHNRQGEWWVQLCGATGLNKSVPVDVLVILTR